MRRLSSLEAEAHEGGVQVGGAFRGLGEAAFREGIPELVLERGEGLEMGSGLRLAEFRSFPALGGDQVGDRASLRVELEQSRQV